MPQRLVASHFERPAGHFTGESPPIVGGGIPTIWVTCQCPSAPQRGTLLAHSRGVHQIAVSWAETEFGLTDFGKSLKPDRDPYADSVFRKTLFRVRNAVGAAMDRPFADQPIEFTFRVTKSRPRLSVRTDNPMKSNLSQKKHIRCAIEIFAACSAICVLGCSSVPYHAESLPVSMRVIPQGNAQTVDLSRLATAAVSNELIAEGDVLEVTVSAGLSDTGTHTFPARIYEDGTADLAEIGRVPLAGLEIETAEVAIRSQYVSQGIYKSPHITVTMKQQRVNRVTVIGAVNEPGIYELPRKRSDLLAAIVAAKGLAEDAGANVEIRGVPHMDKSSTLPLAIADRGGISTIGHSTMYVSPKKTGGLTESIKVNLVSASKQGTGGYPITDGSVVVVEKRAPAPIQIIGLVKKPGRHEFPVGQDLRVLDAIALAGGLRSPVADKVFVIRPVEGQTNPAVIDLSIRKAKRSGRSNLRLAPGDVVSVEQTPATVLIDTIQIIRFGVGASLGGAF